MRRTSKCVVLVTVLAYLPCGNTLALEDAPLWMPVNEEAFVGVPSATRYDTTLKEMMFEFALDNGETKTLSASQLGKDNCRKFGESLRKARLARERQAQLEKQQEEMRLQKQEQDRQLKEAAEFNARPFTLKDGGTVTGKRITEFNDEVVVDCQRYILRLSPDQAAAHGRAAGLFGSTIAMHFRKGTRDKCPQHIDQWANTNGGQTLLQIEEMLSGPMGSVIIPCEDGRALEWSDAWSESMKMWNAAHR